MSSTSAYIWAAECSTIAERAIFFMPESGSTAILVMSIVENRKAFHDYFIEERYEAGIALEGWEVKAIRGGRATIGEAYVMVRGAELFLIGAHISPLADGVDPRHPRSDPHAQAPPARGGDQAPDRQGRAARLYAGAAQPALQQGAHQARGRPGPRQAQARQARGRARAGVESREAAAATRPLTSSPPAPRRATSRSTPPYPG